MYCKQIMEHSLIEQVARVNKALSLCPNEASIQFPRIAVVGSQVRILI